jgi:hypothetical protein
VAQLSGAAVALAATAARETAERLRGEAEALRFVSRRAVELSREHGLACGATFRASRSRLVLVGSPWSDLPWRAADRALVQDLEGALEAV